MENKSLRFHGEDDASGNVSDFENENRIDQAVAVARGVCLAGSHIAANNSFFMMSGMTPAFAFSLFA